MWPVCACRPCLDQCRPPGPLLPSARTPLHSPPHALCSKRRKPRRPAYNRCHTGGGRRRRTDSDPHAQQQGSRRDALVIGHSSSANRPSSSRSATAAVLYCLSSTAVCHCLLSATVCRLPLFCPAQSPCSECWRCSRSACCSAVPSRSTLATSNCRSVEVSVYCLLGDFVLCSITLFFNQHDTFLLLVHHQQVEPMHR